ncbi:MAG: hypothetical protein ABSG17_11260 [Spirochaetia bacterium]|jgi:hypothetical protein
MSKKNASPPEERSEIPEPKFLTEEQFFSLIAQFQAQFQFMLKHEVKNMQLEVVETIGGMLARRSGIDKDLHEMGARVDLLSKSVEGLAGRQAELEKAQGIKPQYPRGARGLSGRKGRLARQDAPAAPDKARPVRLTKDGKPDRRGRPPGKGRYEAYNAAKREKKAGGTP